MGDVYRATDTRLGREVAIKFPGERFTERFEREARAVAALNHANICTLYDVASNYLVMEFVDGVILAERIVDGPISLEEALGLARQIAAALGEAHEKGITHRDWKPANIKIRSDGTVKVDLRFGKILKYGRTRTLASIDIFNLFNSNAVDVYQQNYGPAYLNPLSITQARFFKISVQFDF